MSFGWMGPYVVVEMGWGVERPFIIYRQGLPISYFLSVRLKFRLERGVCGSPNSVGLGSCAVCLLYRMVHRPSSGPLALFGESKKLENHV